MHEAESAAAGARNSAGWREILDRRHSALIEDLEKAIESEIGSAIDSARHDVVESERASSAARRETERREAARLDIEALQQALRRLRQPAENREILKVLNEIAAPWADRSVVVVFENNQAVTVAIRGGEDVAPIVFEIADAPALAAAIESRDMVIALSSPTEISPALAALFESGASSSCGAGSSGAGHTYLFPLALRQSVRAIFIAAGSVVPAPIELLCEVTGLKLELAESSSTVKKEAASAGLVSISAAPVSLIAVPEIEAGRLSWNSLSADDQRLHLQAQRMARVRIAAFRLNHGEALRRGEAAHDIYGALSAQIDPTRTEFLQAFISKSATMVDYLHLEILANLAHNDEKLLGSGYPGPMV